MASHEARGDGYTVRWRTLRGASRRKQVATKEAAKALCRAIERAHDLGREYEPHAVRDAPTMGVLIGEYLRDRARLWRPSTREVRAVSLSIWHAWVSARVGADAGPEVLSRELLADYWSHLRDGRGQAAATANDRTRHVEALWEWSADRHEAVTPRVRRLDLPRAVSRVDAAPSWAQMDGAIREAWTGHVLSRWYGDLMMVLRCTGLRCSQAMELRWAPDGDRPWVDLDGQTLTIPPARPDSARGGAKTSADARTVPLPGVLTEWLAGLGVREGHVVQVPPGRTREPRPITARRIWGRAGVPRHVTPQGLHSFRHGYASGLAAAGVAEEVRRALMGHDRGVHGRYTDLWPAMVEAVSRVPALTGGVLLLRRRGR